MKEQKDIYLSAVGFEGITEKKLEPLVDKMHWINVGQLGKLIQIFQQEHIDQAVMVGQIPPTLVLKDIKLDWKGTVFLAKIKSRRSKDILGALADELEKENVKLLPSHMFLKSEMAEKKIMTNSKPNIEDQADIDFGLPLAQSIADLDIGQTIVVRKKAVVAVEAVEGTDETIKRAGMLMSDPGGVVIKVAMMHHDVRYDIPVIGLTTVQNMVSAQLTTLVIDAEHTLFIDKKAVLDFANQNHIAIVGV